MNYRRVFVPGASYFFTLTLQDRRSDLLICKIKELRIAFQRVMKTCPFTIDGIVVLPEHMHMTMTLPPDDTNYSQRISFIKSAFSRQIEPMECINSSRRIKRERSIWQRAGFGSISSEMSRTMKNIWIIFTTIRLSTVM